MSFLLHLSDLLLDGKEPIDDSVDKIHRRYTIVFLLLLSIPLFTKQFAGEPIECFTPTYFTEAQSRYVNSYCWTVSTFYLDPHFQHQQGGEKEMRRTSTESASSRVHSVDYADDYDTPPVSSSGQEATKKIPIKVSYYQWAPMILVVKAITFYIPFAIWKALARRRGISLRHLMKRITRMSLMDWSHPDRAASLREIVEQIHILLQEEPEYPKFSQRLLKFAILHKKRLFSLFLMIKLLYFLNVLFQFYLLVSFLGEDYLTHGLEIIRHLWTKKQWWASPRFPLQTLCTVRAAQQGSLRLYQCHCVLPINLFTEKICSVWWFYVAGLLPFTLISIMVWCMRGFWISNRVHFVTHHLIHGIAPDNEQLTNKNYSSFALDYLGVDGMFILRLIEINHGSTVLSEIVQSLFERSNDRLADLSRRTSLSSVTLRPADLSTITANLPREETISYEPADCQQRKDRSSMPSSGPSSGPLRESMIRRLSRTTANPAPFDRMRSRMSLQVHSTGIT